jgi:hypothetical protein
LNKEENKYLIDAFSNLLNQYNSIINALEYNSNNRSNKEENQKNNKSDYQIMMRPLHA